jgi:uncharacterized membrane protein
VGPSFSRPLTGLVFVAAGLLHFAVPGVYERIMPPYLPLHRGLVYVSGAAEVLGGLGLLPARTRRVAGVGLILLLAAVLPANVQMLLDARRRQAFLVAGAPVAAPSAAGRARRVGLAGFARRWVSA